MDTKKSTGKELKSDGNEVLLKTFQTRHVLKDHSLFSSLLSVSDEQQTMLNRVEFIINSVFKLLKDQVTGMRILAEGRIRLHASRHV